MRIVTAREGRVFVSFELVNDGDERVIQQPNVAGGPVDVFDGFAADWIATKTREKIAEHLRKYPTFKRADEYIEYALSLPEKHQKYEAFQPISKWSKSQRRAESFRRLAENGNG